MKLLYLAYFAVALAALTYTPPSVAQDAPDQDGSNPPAAAYSFKKINAPGATGTYAYAINNGGEIVGYITGGDGIFRH
jgi:hypothetical protein